MVQNSFYFSKSIRALNIFYDQASRECVIESLFLYLSTKTYCWQQFVVNVGAGGGGGGGEGVANGWSIACMDLQQFLQKKGNTFI